MLVYFGTFWRSSSYVILKTVLMVNCVKLELQSVVLIKSSLHQLIYLYMFVQDFCWNAKCKKVPVLVRWRDCETVAYKWSISYILTNLKYKNISIFIKKKQPFKKIFDLYCIHWFVKNNTICPDVAQSDL